MHVYGQLLRAQVENSASNPSPAALGMIYWNTGSSEFRICTNTTGPVWTPIILDNLATTKGDILARTSSALTRLAVGSNGLPLVADSGQATGLSYAQLAAAGLATRSVTSIKIAETVATATTTYNATETDGIILCSGSAFTVNLPAASGKSGKILVIKKTDSSFSNIITIDGNASETIDGALTITLNTQYEAVKLICDGSNWHILEHTYPKEWTSYTPTFTGFGTESNVGFVWRRVGDSIEIQGRFTAGTPTATEARISLPSGLTSSDSTKIQSTRMVGYFQKDTADTDQEAVAIEASKTYVVFFTQGSVASLTKRNGNGLAGVGTSVSLYCTVPIAGWIG